MFAVQAAERKLSDNMEENKKGSWICSRLVWRAVVAAMLFVVGIPVYSLRRIYSILDFRLEQEGCTFCDIIQPIIQRKTLFQASIRVGAHGYNDIACSLPKCRTGGIFNCDSLSAGARKGTLVFRIANPAVIVTAIIRAIKRAIFVLFYISFFPMA